MNLNLAKSWFLLLPALALAPATGSPGPAPTPQGGTPPPVLFYWSCPVVEAVESEAWSLVIQMENHMAMNHLDDYAARVFTEGFGETRTVHWFAPFESLAERIRVEEVVSADEGWQALLDRREGLFDLERLQLRHLVHLGGLAPKKTPKPWRWMQTTHSLPSKRVRAERFARDVADYLEATYDEIDAHVYTADFQEPSAIYWMIDFDSPVEWTAFRARLQGDDAYLDLFDRAEGLFLEDRTTEMIIVD
jgi:hypothetical protein